MSNQKHDGISIIPWIACGLCCIFSLGFSIATWVKVNTLEIGVVEQSEVIDEDSDTSEESDTSVLLEVPDDVKNTKAYKYFDRMNGDNLKLVMTIDDIVYEDISIDGEIVRHNKGEIDGEKYDTVMYTKDNTVYVADRIAKQYYSQVLSDVEIAEKETYMKDLVTQTFVSLSYEGEKGGYEVFVVDNDEESSDGVSSEVEESKSDSSKSDSSKSDSSKSDSSKEESKSTETDGKLYMKVDGDTLIGETRDTNGKVVVKSEYKIVGVSDDDKKLMSIDGYKLMDTTESSTELPDIPSDSDEESSN